MVQARAGPFFDLRLWLAEIDIVQWWSSGGRLVLFFGVQKALEWIRLNGYMSNGLILLFS